MPITPKPVLLSLTLVLERSGGEWEVGREGEGREGGRSKNSECHRSSGVQVTPAWLPEEIKDELLNGKGGI